MTEQETYLEWKSFIKDEELHADLEQIGDNEAEIYDRFYRHLDFGTAGLRGLLGAGTNRMNIYTVRQATKGLADYLCAQKDAPAVAIAYDTRHNSERFAKDAACVLAANGIKVWLYGAPAPTPMLSYAVRERFCDAGIVITASHNPAQYNGYKVYGPDGCQISPETAAAVTEYRERVDVLRGAKLCDFDEAVAEKKIILLPDSFWRRYYARVLKEGVDRAHHYENDLSIVYTPLNGTGAVPVVTTLSLGGFGNVAVVPEQERPDSAFTTCPTPNPELREALSLALKQAESCGADLVLATDPDCDRIGVASKEADGYRLFTGNEMGALLLDFIALARKENGNQIEKPVAVRSLVSTKLADEVAAFHNVAMKKVPVGFRYIGKVIAELEKAGEAERFLFGFEESCGYLAGTYARDKDGVCAALLVCELANFWKSRGKTLGEALNGLWEKFGYYRDFQDNFYFEGASGAFKMAKVMEDLRAQKPSVLGGETVLSVTDHQPKSNMLEFVLKNGDSFLIRPSGTEPKMKIYYSVKAENREKAWEKGEALRLAVKAFLGF